VTPISSADKTKKLLAMAMSFKDQKVISDLSSTAIVLPTLKFGKHQSGNFHMNALTEIAKK